MKFLVAVIILFSLAATSDAKEGVAWGSSRTSARATCFANHAGGRTAVVRSFSGTYYGTRKFGPFAWLRARTVSRARAVTRTRGHL